MGQLNESNERVSVGCKKLTEAETNGPDGFLWILVHEA